MKRTVLSSALLTLLSTVIYADNSVPAAAPAAAKPTTTTSAPSANPAPANASVPTPEAVKPSVLPAPLPEPVIDCKYRIPAETTTIAQTLVSTWAGKAAVQSFNFNPATMDEELGQLKSCYTDQGWQGFNDALTKSGNIDAIKTQHLTVSSQVDGEIKVTPIKDNQWKVNIPLQAVYQNDKEKLTQLLTIDLLIGRKISGDLGIMQMIATPRQTGAPEQPTASQPSAPAAAPVSPVSH